jgi:hypothetical protein
VKPAKTNSTLAPTLNYQIQQPKGQAGCLTLIMLFAGCGVLLLGVTMAIIAETTLRGSETNPNFGWGPRAYIFGMLESFVALALVLTPAGVIVLMVGWRRLRAGK